MINVIVNDYLGSSLIIVNDDDVISLTVVDRSFWPVIFGQIGRSAILGLYVGSKSPISTKIAKIGDFG